MLREFSPRVSESPEDAMDRLFDNLGVPEEGKREGDGSYGSSKTVIFEDKSVIQVDRDYYATDMGGEGHVPVFRVNMNGAVKYTLSHYLIAIDSRIPQPFKLEVPEDKRVEVGTVLVNWTKENIQKGKMSESPVKLDFPR